MNREETARMMYSRISGGGYACDWSRANPAQRARYLNAADDVLRAIALRITGVEL